MLNIILNIEFYAYYFAKVFIFDNYNSIMIHQCYYCERIFDTKEALYDHLDIHADIKDTKDDNKKKLNK